MAILFDHVGKRYAGKDVLSRIDWRIAPGERWLVRGPSGAGKTTLLRLLVGLELPDEGRILGTDGVRFSMCFQENRLCARLSSLANIAMVCPDPDPARIRNALLELLPEDAILQPAETLSGGMARRTALARALLAPSDIVVLDEPFAGLDDLNQAKALAFLSARLAGRALVLVSHEQVPIADAQTFTLPSPPQ